MRLARLLFILAACGGSSSTPKPDAYPTAEHTPYPVLPDQGGARLTSPQLVTVTFNNDARASALEGFAQWIVTSDWLTAVGSEYGITPGGIAGVAHRPEVPPQALTSADVENYLAGGITDGSIPKPADLSQALYIVYYPMGTTITTTFVHGIIKVSCTDYGAYHGEAHAMGLDFSYAVVPDCGESMAELESAVSHEFIEASTDAMPISAPARQLREDATDAWFTNFQFEVEDGDMCEAPERTVTIAGYTVQRTWSNVAAVSGDPCVPSGAPVGFGTSGPATVQTIAAGGSADVPLVGWSSGPVDDWKLTAQIWFADGTTTTRPHLSLDQTTLNNGGTATAHVTVPTTATSGQRASFLIISAHTPATDQQMWPVSVQVQ